MDFENFLLKAEDHLTRKIPFVLYRKPSDPLVKGIFQRDEHSFFLSDFTERGFVFAPFNSNKPALLLRPDEQVSTSYQHGANKTGQLTEPPAADTQAQQFHLDLVAKGIAKIKAGDLEKVVLSRNIEARGHHSPLKVFQTLLNKYITAFCYLWYHPVSGLWMGATPETLVSIRKNELTTMSLAGTYSYQDGKPPVWTTKERKEQGLVTTYLLDKLRPFTTALELTEENAVRAGQLWHLMSQIRGRLKKNELGEVIRALHPTPAVCGIPLEVAKDFILEKEGYDREFYTGYLGELGLDGESDCDLYVNLRCMQLVNDMALVYVGGGITAESDPQSEWGETVAKSNTMLKALFNS
ncbi:chorismate-binding protein [Poritiphilus flavus]|uniref:isochorismate synthase n=1 Tax=Poritiphilus flavus TaxID=2697053 RepID=A0A6L9EFM2_9FLAO|nr:isochorismate synthase [Poritiphilus flavus]NAS13443.1 isochorismate synthase [Poritiphilus flavus]